MSVWPGEVWTLSFCALLALGGCSHPSGLTGETTHPAPSANSPSANAPACAPQPVRLQDLAGILVAPLTAAKAVSGDAETCEYSTGNFPAITISVRPGLGRSTVEAWMSGRMPLKASPIAGVGDAAVWQSSLHEVIAQKRNLLCDIQVRGGVDDIALAADELPGALGAVCNRIFAG